MTNRKYNDEAMQWLRERWTADMINHIVVALNEGRTIDSVLEDLPQDEMLPHHPNRMDLRGIDFSHQNLRGPWEFDGDRRQRCGVVLKKADLTGANLSWVILPKADLREALFIDADLKDAELIYSNLSKADLTGADMRGAWLLDTKFIGAKIGEEQLKSRRNLGQLDFDYYAYEI
ncbi:MAG: pentapeptide repeat-containing protein [bacterium]